MKYTYNTFKNEVRGMTKEGQKELLDELQSIKMTEYTRAIRGESGLDVRVIKKQIAILKTIMREQK